MYKRLRELPSTASHNQISLRAPVGQTDNRDYRREKGLLPASAAGLNLGTGPTRPLLTDAGTMVSSVLT